MLLEYLLRHTVLIEVQYGRGAREVLGDTPPGRSLSLKLIG